MKLGSFYLQMHALVLTLIPDIGDEYRSQDSEPDDDTPSMTLTVGADAKGWSYQTGDNSFVGGVYGYSRPWAVVTLYRDSDAHEMAEDIIISQLNDYEDDDEPSTFDSLPKRNEMLVKVRDTVRNRYTSVGGYPIYCYTADGAMLCADCVKSEYRLISRSTRESARDGWAIEAVDVYWEGAPIQCAYCNKDCESAYGDPDAEVQS